MLVRFVTRPAELADADLVVLPGSRATVADLGWLRDRGLVFAAIAARAARNQPVLGICGGYQMLARRIHDRVESGAGTVEALGLLRVSVELTASKTLGRPAIDAVGTTVTGYEIHHRQVTVHGQPGPFPGGCCSGAVWGTSWHGTLENDEFRRAFLTEVAAAADRDSRPAPTTDFAAVREARLDRLAGLTTRHLNTAALTRLITHGRPPPCP